MQTTTTNAFRKAKIWFANKFLFTFTFILTFLLLMVFAPYQSTAQQSPAYYPFSMDLNLGNGLIGNPSVNSAIQPEIGFNYMPGKLGAGLNAGFMSYDSSFNPDQYTAGFEDFTSIARNGEKWTSFYIGIGPRFEFGRDGRLPVTFRSSLDLALTYNSPPESSVNFNDPAGSSGDSQLQLSGFNPGDSYSKWSAALRPEFQIQFSPGGNDRFAINVTTGIQHRLTKNEFTYAQKDLSKIRKMDNPQEMFFQFDNAPEIQRSAAPPQTNFFTSVGIKIKFGKSRQVHKEGVIHRDIASRAAPDGSEAGDCDDSDDSRCVKPGETTSNDADSDGDGIDDGTEMAQDYNSSRSNRPSTRAADGGGDCDDGTPCPHPGEKIAPAQDYNSSRSNKSRTEDDREGNEEIIREASRMARLANPTGIIVKVGGMSAKGKKALGLALENGHSPIYEGDAVGGENALARTEANDSSEDDFSTAGANSPIYELADAGGNGDGDNNTDPPPSQRYNMQPSSYCMEVATMKMSTDSQKAMRSSQNGDMNNDETAMATSHNASRLNRSQGINDQSSDTDIDADSSIVGAQNHNSSRSNKTNAVRNETGENDFDSTSVNTAIPPKIHGIAADDPTNLMPSTEQNGFPEFMETASLTITKRKRPGRARYGDITLKKSMNNGDDLDGDGLGDAAGLNVELEMGDPDSDADGLMDALEAASYSLSLENTGENFSSAKFQSSGDDPCGPGVWARTTGGNENCSPENPGQENHLAQEGGWQESPVTEVAPRDNVHQWTYKLSALSDGDNMPGNGTLTVTMTGSKLHFNVHFDPDSNEGGYSELLQNSSFSISKRSARTGRNPQSSRK